MSLVNADSVYNNTFIDQTNMFHTEDLVTSRSSGISLYFFIFILIVALLLYSEYVRIPALFLVTGVGLFFYAILIYSKISAIIGIVIMLFSFMIMIRGMTIK